MTPFLVDASLPKATGALIRSRGFLANDVRDMDMGTASDVEIASAARTRQLCLISRDSDFGNILNYPPGDYAGLVVVQAPDAAGRQFVLGLIERFLEQRAIVEQVAGKLVVIEADRIRIRAD